MKIVGVNGRVFSRNLLNDAIADSPNAPGSIELLVLNNEYYHIAKVDYHGGLRYPHLERNPTVPEICRTLSGRARRARSRERHKNSAQRNAGHDV